MPLLPIPQPVREGYVFIGWSESEYIQLPIVQIVMDEDKTVYAIWEESDNEPEEEGEPNPGLVLVPAIAWELIKGWITPRWVNAPNWIRNSLGWVMALEPTSSSALNTLIVGLMLILGTLVLVAA